MKEILFRGQKPDNKEWVYGSLLESDDGKKVIVVKNKNFISKQDNRGWYINAPCYEVIPETVGQFINEEDTKKHKLFEGDIVEAFRNAWPFKPGYRDVVTLENRMYWLKNEGFGYEGEDLQDPANYIIIGNIYDNPELIKT